jgi:uncharacterized damage-inducible protein DinB
MNTDKAMNPYASFLDNRDPISVIASTSTELARILNSLPAERVTAAPAPGKWSAREILAHLADTEIVFAYRLRQALAEDHHVIQPFDQDVWSKVYGSFDAASALAVFSTVRSWNLILIGQMSADDLRRPITHPERGTVTVQTIVETMGGHDVNHLRQLTAIA